MQQDPCLIAIPAVSCCLKYTSLHCWLHN